MASDLVALLSWKNKSETLKLFTGLNLSFYLLILADYTILSLLSSVLIIFIVVINTHSLVHKTKCEDDHFEYLSRDLFEELFTNVFTLWKWIKDQIETSSEFILQAIVGIYLFNFWAGILGVEGTLWVLVNLAFVLTPQYYQNKELVDGQIAGVSEKLREGRQLVYEIIPKYRASN